MLGEMDRAFAGKKNWCLVGSSLGGWLAARWAELHPDRVHSLLLLCPAFKMRERWPNLVGPDNFRRWREEGAYPFPDADGVRVPVHFGLMTEAETQPSTPEVPCPTLILHGTKDETVPIALSREYAAKRPDRVRLLEIDDDHRMLSSADLISTQVLTFFEIGGSPART